MTVNSVIFVILNSIAKGFNISRRCVCVLFYIGKFVEDAIWKLELIFKKMVYLIKVIFT